jgi:hypothetical protein
MRLLEIIRGRQRFFFGWLIVFSLFSTALSATVAVAESDETAPDLSAPVHDCYDNFVDDHDTEAFYSCRELERLASPMRTTAIRLRSLPSLSWPNFTYEFTYYRAESIYSPILAKLYSDRKDDKKGRKYAMEAIQSSFIDAGLCYFFLLHKDSLPANLSNFGRSIEPQARQGIEVDKEITPSMDTLYPGIFGEFVGKYHNTKEQYNAAMRAFASADK